MQTQHEREEVDPSYSPPGLGYVIAVTFLAIAIIIPACVVLVFFLQRK